eukprot:gene24965-33464_t
MSSNYSPNGAVIAAHNIPVFDQNLRPIQVDFSFSASVSAAFHIIADGIYQLTDLLNSAIRFVGNILFHVVIIRHLLSSPLCSGFDRVLLLETKVDLQYIVTASNSLNGFAQNALSSLHSLEYTLRYAAVAKKHVAVGILFALILFAVAFQLLSFLFRNEISMRIAAGVTFLVVLVLLVVGSVMMLPVKVMGDFCMDPNNNFIQLFHGNLARVVSFYVFCSGSTNLLQREVKLMESVLADAERVLLQAKPTIAPQCYDAMQSNYSSIASNISSLAALLPCPNLNHIYSDMVLGGVCSTGATGLYNIWLLVFLLAAFLFVVLCLGNLIYAHYGLHLQNEALEVQDEADQQQVGEGDVIVTHETGATIHPHNREGQVAAGRNQDDVAEKNHRTHREVEMVSMT